MSVRTADKTRAAPPSLPATNGHQRPPRKVTYPESDGKPMAETWIHVKALVRLLMLLRMLFQQRNDVHLGGNMMMYWVEGDPRHRVSPDAFVKMGTPPEPARRTWKTWEEGVPTVIFEMTSKKTRKNDTNKKRPLYEELGVQEYFLFDPLGEYLRPRFQGYHLVDGAYAPLEQDDEGGISSPVLGARFLPEGDHLRVFNLAANMEILDTWDTPAVAEAQLREQATLTQAETARALAEAARAQTEAARAEAAERRVAELERLLRERDGR